MFIICYQRIKNEGFKTVIKRTWQSLKSDLKIKKIFVFSFVLAMVLFSTIFCRVYQSNPLEVVWGNWVVFREYHILHTEPIENVLLFIPYTFCFLWAFPSVLYRGKKIIFIRTVWKALMLALTSSVCIEMIQLIFRVGTLQISDIVYNTLGGVMGGIGYHIIYRLWYKVKKQ